MESCLSAWKPDLFPTLHYVYTSPTFFHLDLGAYAVSEFWISLKWTRKPRPQKTNSAGYIGYISQREWPQQWKFPTIRWRLIFNSSWLGCSSFPPNTSLLSHPCAIGSPVAFQKTRSTQDLILTAAWERGTRRLRCLLSMCFSPNGSSRICHLCKPVSMGPAKRNESKFGSL